MKSLDKNGFTFPELVISIGILAILFGMGIVSLLNIKVLSANTSDITVLISDLRSQQIKAITGDTEGRGVPDVHGVKILPSQYVLFHGDTYDPSETSNIIIPLESGHVFSTTIPDASIVFATSSGEMVGFVEGSNSVTLTNSDTQQSKSIFINKYGTVIQVN